MLGKDQVYESFHAAVDKVLTIWQVKFVQLSIIRQVVRLIALHSTSGFPESSEWAEIESLSQEGKNGGEYEDTAKEIASGIDHFMRTDLSQAELVRLIFSMMTNEVVITLPLLHPHGEGYIPASPYTMKVGSVSTSTIPIRVKEVANHLLDGR